MEKKCSKCFIVKPAAEFYAHPQTKDGRLYECKVCVKERVRNNKTDYGLTEKGVIRVIYKTQKRRNALRGHGVMGYSKTELKEWLYENNYKELFDSWVSSGYQKDLKPSVDRIDTFKGYSIDNIRLVTWGQNKQFQTHDILNGTGTSGKRCKPLVQYDQNLKPLAKFISYSSAMRVMGYSLDHSIRNNRPDRNGYYWKYL
jgi:hypothetical protein